MKNTIIRSVATLATAAALPLGAQAQGSETWKFGAAIYGWVPAIGGQLTLPSGTSTIGVSMGDVLDSLEFAFMGTFEATYGKWGLWTDLVYSSFGDTKTLDRNFTIGGGVPVNVNGQFVLDTKSWIWTLAGSYNLVDSAENKTDLLFGTRMLDMSNTLDWNLNCTGGGGGSVPTAARSKPLANAAPSATGGSCGGIHNPGSAQASLTNWDAVIGLKGRFMFGDERRWFVNYVADIGTGESKLTYQGVLGLGYDFGWGSMLAAWRYMAYDFKSSSHVQDLNFNGPLVGAVFRF